MAYIPTILNQSNFDAFSRLRTSTPTTVFDSQLQYGLSPLSWQTYSVSGASATHLPSQSSAQITMPVTNGARLLRQTYRYFRYQPGKSQLIIMTGVLGVAVANQNKNIGYYDDQNGYFFQRTGTTVNAVERTFVSGVVVENAVPQASWNIDPFNGSGPSGVTLDVTKAQIFIIDAQWLGVGTVRMGFSIGGKIYYAHAFQHANVLATAYTTTFNLPLRYEAINTAVSAGSNDMRQICSSVSSEAGFEDAWGRNFSAMTPIGTPKTVPTTGPVSVLAIRMSSTFGGIDNRGFVLPLNLDVMTGTNNISFELIFLSQGTGYTPGTFTAANPDSIVEFDTTGTLVLPTTGLTVDCGFVAAGQAQTRSVASANLLNKLQIARNYNPIPANAVSDVLCLAATATGGSASVNACITWQEVR